MSNKLKKAREIANEIVDNANHRATDNDLYSTIIEKGGDDISVIVNSVTDSIWTGIDNGIDPIDVIHRAILRLTFQMPSDELHDEMKTLLRMMDEKYGI